MKQRWTLPGVLLLILLVALALRWANLGTQTEGTMRVTYLHDRWAGRVWARYAGVSGGQLVAGEALARHNLHNPWTKPLNSDDKQADLLYARRERAIWTGFWVLFVTVDALWLCWAIRRSRNERVGTSAVPQ